jgi:hypothetical protein
MFKKVSLLFLGFLFSLSAEACLIGLEEFLHLPIMNQEEIHNNQDYLVFRGVVYDMDRFSKSQAQFHKRQFVRIKKTNKSQISETDYQTHNESLPIFLKNVENAVGRE